MATSSPWLQVSSQDCPLWTMTKPVGAATGRRSANQDSMTSCYRRRGEAGRLLLLLLLHSACWEEYVLEEVQVGQKMEEVADRCAAEDLRSSDEGVRSFLEVRHHTVVGLVTTWVIGPLQHVCLVGSLQVLQVPPAVQ